MSQPRPDSAIDVFFRACARGDLDTLRDLLTHNAALARERGPDGGTGLHAAVRHPEAVRLLLAHGADPNARDTGDNATPLHFAAGSRCLESVRLLLDAGADVQGDTDVHDGGVIGWAAARGNEAVVELLLQRGARHHIFSALALGDLDRVRALVAENPDSLKRRRSRFENEQTPLHAAFAPPDGQGARPNHAMLQLLIELGADLEATDDKGRTPMALAMLRGDHEAIRLLHAAGAKMPPRPTATGDVGAVGDSIQRLSPFLFSPDVEASLAWYTSIGFKVVARHPEEGEIGFLLLSFGGHEVAFQAGHPGTTRLKLWFEMVGIDAYYQLLKARQMAAMDASIGGRTDGPLEVRFLEDLFNPFYGGRQFSVADNNGVELIFHEGFS